MYFTARSQSTLCTTLHAAPTIFLSSYPCLPIFHAPLSETSRRWWTNINQDQIDGLSLSVKANAGVISSWYLVIFSFSPFNWTVKVFKIGEIRIIVALLLFSSIWWAHDMVEIAIWLLPYQDLLSPPAHWEQYPWFLHMFHWQCQDQWIYCSNMTNSLSNVMCYQKNQSLHHFMTKSWVLQGKNLFMWPKIDNLHSQPWT